MLLTTLKELDSVVKRAGLAEMNLPLA
jgi:hypothetical protein